MQGPNKNKTKAQTKNQDKKEDYNLWTNKKRDYILETRNYALVAEYKLYTVKESKLKLKTGNKTCTNSRIVGVQV